MHILIGTRASPFGTVGDGSVMLVASTIRINDLMWTHQQPLFISIVESFHIDRSFLWYAESYFPWNSISFIIAFFIFIFCEICFENQFYAQNIFYQMNPNGKKEKMIIHLFGEITFFVMKKICYFRTFINDKKRWWNKIISNVYTNVNEHTNYFLFWNVLNINIKYSSSYTYSIYNSATSTSH